MLSACLPRVPFLDSAQKKAEKVPLKSPFARSNATRNNGKTSDSRPGAKRPGHNE